MSAPHPPSREQILGAVCAVMDVSIGDLPGKTTPRTRPRLQWARNMTAFVMHDLGQSDRAIAQAFGSVHRITIMVRRRRMAEKLEATQLYRDHHSAILTCLASARIDASSQAVPPPAWDSQPPVNHHQRP